MQTPPNGQALFGRSRPAAGYDQVARPDHGPRGRARGVLELAGMEVALHLQARPGAPLSRRLWCSNTMAIAHLDQSLAKAPGICWMDAEQH